MQATENENRNVTGGRGMDRLKRKRNKKRNNKSHSDTHTHD